MVREEYHSRPVSALIRDWLLYNKAGGGGGILKTVTGNPISISDALAAPIQSLSVSLSPIQEGSGDPSPDNIRPITRRTAVTAVRAEKNLLDMSTPFRTGTIYYNPAIGTQIESGTASDITVTTEGNTVTCRTAGPWRGVTWRSHDLPNGTYHLHSTQAAVDMTDSQNARDVLVVDKDNYVKRIVGHSAVWGTIDLTITLTGDETAIVLSVGGRGNTYGTFVLTDSILETGSVYTGWSPYDSQSVTVQLGQTVFAGNAEIISGQGESTMAMVDLGTLNWNGPSYGRYYSAAIPDAMPNAYLATYLVCTCYRAGTPAPSLQNGQIAIDNQRRIFIRDSRFTDKSQIAADLSGQYLCYRIATPTSLTLTPASLSTLRGDNNVWSDGDEITMTYKAASE